MLRSSLRLMLLQAITVAPGVMLNVVTGMIAPDYDGTLNEIMCTPGIGNQRFMVRHVYASFEWITTAANTPIEPRVIPGLFQPPRSLPQRDQVVPSTMTGYLGRDEEVFR